MFTRMLEFKVNPESRDMLLKLMSEEIIPILRKQVGFVDVIGLTEDTDTMVCTTLSFWSTKADADRYVTETYHKVTEILKPHIATALKVRTFNVETSTFHKIAGVAAR